MIQVKRRFMVVRTINGKRVPSSTIKSDLTESQANILVRKLKRGAHESVDFVVVPEIVERVLDRYIPS